MAQVSGLDHDDPNNYPVLTDFFWQMMETALLCDATRVASLSFGNTAFRFSMPWLDAPLIPEVNTGERKVHEIIARLGLDPRNQIPPGLERVWGLITTTEMTPDRIAGLEATLQAWADMDRRRRQG